MPKIKKQPAELSADDKAKAIARIEGEAKALITVAKRVAVVTDAETEARATEFLTNIKAQLKAADEARLKLVKPIKDHAKMIDDEFKLTTRPLSEADELVRQGMRTYRNSPEFKAAESKRLEIEAQGRMAVAAGDSEALTRLTDEHEQASQAAPRKVETQSGEARFRKVWCYEIVDIEALPAAFWMPDEAKIKATVKAGITIAGVRAWEESQPIIY